MKETTIGETKKIQCEDAKKSLIITTVQYTNDYLNQCVEEKKSFNTSKLLKSILLCSAYPTQKLANICNGRQECDFNLDVKNFSYGFDGSNCDFKAEVLSISYQCIPSKKIYLN